MYKVLIVGGSYFIGKAVVDTFLKSSDYAIYVLNRGTHPYENTDRIVQLIADRNDEECLRTAVGDLEFDYVVDISCYTGLQAQSLCKTLTTKNIKQICFLSSSAIYTDSDETIKKEISPLGVNKYWGEYGTDKINAENVYKNFSKKNKIPLVIIRPPYVYGEHNYARRESFVFDHIINNKPVIIPYSNNKIQFIYVYDLAKVIFNLQNNKQLNLLTTINVGNKNAITFCKWVKLCGEIVGIKPRLYFYTGNKYESKQYFPFHAYNNILDTSTMRAIVNYEETSMVDGLLNAYKWFLENKDTILFNENSKKIENIIFSQKIDIIKANTLDKEIHSL